MSNETKITFWQRYLGPQGPHLSHRTFFTQTERPAPADTQCSIHPRVVRGRTVHPKVNTCK
jgi:hypothetical protein